MIGHRRPFFRFVATWSLRAGALLFVAAMLLVSLMDDAALALTCKPRLDVQGPTDPLHPNAMTLAIAQWTAVATAKYGPLYAHWAIAQKSAPECRQIKATFGIKVWFCKVKAKPCKA